MNHVPPVPRIEIKYQDVNGTFYHDETAQPVIDAIERARANGWRIYVYHGDVKTGRQWDEGSFERSGTVSRSMGPIKVPLLIHNVTSTGGGSMLDHCIIRIRHANKRSGGDLYRHPKFHNPHSQQALEEDALEEADAGIGAKS